VTNPLLESLRRAVESAPDDVPLRLHLAELLIADGQQDAAISQCAAALQREPGSAAARELMTRAMGHLGGSAPTPEAPAATSSPAGAPSGPSAGSAPRPSPSAPSPSGPRQDNGFDWSMAESEVSDVAPQPMFVDGEREQTEVSAWDVERSTLTLADVGGMRQVKERLTAAFLAPMQHPELRKLYGKSLRGGMLLYGPPGCGKTFIGRAIAGELGVHFLNVGLADVLDMYMGTSERNI